MKQVKSCGFILFKGNRANPQKSFLLMKHPDRYDLPKGHIELGETDLECALREMNEETGIPIDAVQIETGFEYRSVYHPQYARYDNEIVEKTLIILLIHRMHLERKSVLGALVLNRLWEARQQEQAPLFQPDSFHVDAVGTLAQSR